MKKVFSVFIAFMLLGLIVKAQNLALGKPVNTSSEDKAGNIKSNAVDGNLNTRWTSEAGKDPQWIYVDLGKSYNVNTVKLTWKAGECATDFKIEVSTNSTSWSLLKAVTGNTALINNYANTLDGEGRYVRIYCTKRANNLGYSLNDMEVSTSYKEGIFLGTVKFYNVSKGFGFIRDSQNGAQEYFVHVSRLKDPITEGDAVQFRVKQGSKGLDAVDVRLQ
jgi:cold shock CspA family protein